MMPFWGALGLGAIILGLMTGCVSNRSPQPSPPQSLLNEAIDILKVTPLGAARVDWQKARRAALADLPHDPELADAHEAIRHAVSLLADPHAQFIPPPAPPAPPSSPVESESAALQSAPAPTTHPPIPVLPQVTALADGVVYILIPGCSAPDVDGLREFARTLAEGIQSHAAHAKGWVVDLRLNGGGNLWPMLLGLRPLLNDGSVMMSVTDEGPNAAYGVDADSSWIRGISGSSTSTSIQLTWGESSESRPDVSLVSARRIAVLCGSWTMSSGEAVLLSFSGDHRTRTFGEQTAGLTTVTNYYPLSDGSILILPIAEMADRHGDAPRGKIMPQQQVEFGDWPTADDAAADAARRWVLAEGH